MRYLVFVMLLTSSLFASGASVCSDTNTVTKVARDGVKSMVELSGMAPYVVAYYGGVESEKDGLVIVNVQPFYFSWKDWYKVTVRHKDCRILNVKLFEENLPISK